MGFSNKNELKKTCFKATTAGPQQVYLYFYVSLNKLKQVACSIGKVPPDGFEMAYLNGVLQ